MSDALVHQVPSNSPSTHALVIGVGRYPHLLGGDSTLLQEHQGLRQLSSPPVSARAVANWLVDSFANPDKPLASVRLLLSEASAEPFVNERTGRKYTPPRANYDAVRAALREWRVDGDSDEDNLLLFVFCGHGLGNGPELALLLEDFGASTENPLEGALDFRKLHLGMQARCRARQQCYFVDACRSDAEITRYSDDNAGMVPVLPGPTKGPIEAPIFYSTLMGQDAFGRPKQPSYFTEALLHGLRGAGSDQSLGGWRVSTTQLKNAIDAQMRRRAEGGGSPQLAPAGNLTTFTLHHLAGDPEVPVYVHCDPEEAQEQATLECSANGSMLYRHPAPGPWELSLRVGEYRFAASATTGHRGHAVSRYVHPPQLVVPLKVSP